ncbi:MAG: hypothetical protein ABIJ39_12665 [Chloroflexota bacterium]
MPVKLLMTWNITPGRDQEYFEFVISDFIPGVQRLGLHPIEAWVTAFGDYPQIQVAMLVEDLKNARLILDSKGWQDLSEKLFALVENFTYKVIPAKGGFQF